jgi:phenylacetate-CoA ligase
MVHVSYGYGLFTGGLGAHYGAEKLGLTVVPFGGGQTERQVQLIQDFRPDIIMVTPSYMLAIADEVERQGINPADSPAHRHLRRRALDQRHAPAIEQRAGIDAVDIYGLSEVMGPAWPASAPRPRTARPSGKTISTPRSSTPRPASRWPTARWASWSSPA